MASRRKTPRAGTPKGKPRVAPAPKFTPSIREKILKSLRVGNFRATACRRAKITDRQFRRWLDRGDEELKARDEALERAEKGERVEVPELTEYGSFALEVRQVECEAEQRCLGVILNGENDDIRWFLERRYPKRWGKAATKLEISGPDGGAVKVEDARRSLFDRLAAQLDRLGAEAGPAQGDPQPAE